MVSENTPDLWKSVFPIPAPDGHKYDRGHTVILGSDRYTGATRLASEAASRVGSGLVTVLSETQADTYRRTLPADIMVSERGLSTINRPSVLLAGPGGCSDAQADTVTRAPQDLIRVLDADAIRLAHRLKTVPTILTPHAGEFERYLASDSDLLSVSKAVNSVLVLKGPETQIAAPDGRLVVNRVATRYLAKAGTGDVLAGLIAGLATQGMPTFEAACAGVWLHGYAAQRIGPGLIPQDITGEMRAILSDLIR